MKKNWKKLLLSFVLTFSAAAIGSLATFNAISTWYAYLVKPSFNPPNWIFGPVWTLLYALMAVALYIIWNQKYKQKYKQREQRLTYIFFASQLVLNVLWSVIFFGLRQPFIAFIEIIFLWTAILLTVRQFRKLSDRAALLLLPYQLWVSFASVLNAYIVMFN